MKTTIKILMTGLVLIAMQACEDYLDKEPISDVAEGNFYKTASDAESGLIACYDALQSEYYIFDLFTNGDVISDNCYAGGDNPANFQLDNLTITPTNDNVNRDWGYIYSAINLTNAVLDNVPAIDDPKLEINNRKEQILGEARFLRANHYFNLVRLWGSVPIVEHVTKSTAASEVQIPQSSIDEVYNFIISDLEAAIEALPETYSTEAETRGRATKGAANALLAKVYASLPTPQWDKVITYSDQVMNSNVYSLLPDYQQLFDGAHYNNAESILEIQFIGGSPEANWGPQLWLPPSLTGDGWRKFNTPSVDLINAYNEEQDSIRLEASVLFEDNLPWTDEKWGGNRAPFPYKWKHADGWSSPDHTYLLRLADIMLLKAEAENETGNATMAAEILNAIRNRVKLMPTTAITQEALRMAIEKERRLELAFEGHRWYDLKRTNQAVAVMSNLGYTIDENKLWLPIPQQELDLNPNLQQNEGY